MNPLHQAALLLGTNLGDRVARLQQARELITARAGTALKESKIYFTSAWGIEEQPDFLNQALLLETWLDPPSLLKVLLKIESDMGRIREQKWGPRLIDIDILYYEDIILDAPQLHLPHPFLPERRFSLIPLLEIAPEWVHPISRKNLPEMIRDCPDTGEVHLYSQQ